LKPTGFRSDGVKPATIIALSAGLQFLKANVRTKKSLNNPADGAIEVHKIFIATEHPGFDGRKVSRVCFLKSCVAGPSRKLELLMIPEIEPPLAVAVPEAGDVFQITSPMP
jgi:hypothetical protein